MIRKIMTTPWPGTLWTLAIFILLTIDTHGMETGPVIPYMDKVVHAVVFGLLAFLWGNFFSSKGKDMWLAIFLLTALYGAGMEFYQESFTTREFEWNDIVADALGAGIGSLIGKKIGPYGNRGRNQN